MKKTLILIALLCTLPSLSNAQNGGLTEISVACSGQDKNEALKNCFDLAVNDVFGVYVYSRNKIKNSQSLQSETRMVSSGYIVDYTVLFEEKINDRVHLTLDVTVDTRQIQKTDAEAPGFSFEEKISDLAIADHSQEKLSNAAAILSELVGDKEHLLEKGYRFTKAGYRVSDVGADSIRGYFLVKISRNDLFWDRYWRVIESLKETPGPNTITEGFYGYTAYDGTCLDFNPRVSKGYGQKLYTNVEPRYVHRSLKPYLAPVVEGVIEIGGHSLSIGFHKNAIMVPFSGKKFEHFAERNDSADFEGFVGWKPVDEKNNRSPNRFIETAPLKPGSYYYGSNGAYPKSTEIVVATKKDLIVRIPFEVQDTQDIVEAYQDGLSLPNTQNI
ncbi:hypothetical protein [Geoalkalibacter subterraneus]|uniref:Uncharacterized protein n=1 Tax=Geoalkalibacter subterraneus TaxID=483547 RepID=A0A0B5FX51_9BACT|nr:hypothetical protein [Geoalkalibacter subterraneus]AJF08176.1 hypothetical protein GSUB_16905 [Geoalkalibacter subterraneus]